MKQVTVIFEGQEEAAEELNFETAKEGWSDYAIEGGVTIKMKNVVSRVLKLLNKKKPDGTPFYVFEGVSIISVINPDAVVMVSQPSQQSAKGN